MSKELTIENISDVLETTVNPLLNSHNGGVILKKLENKVALVKFTGACAGCLSADETLENVVKDTLFKEFPDLEDIELDRSVDEDLLDFARKLLNKN